MKKEPDAKTISRGTKLSNDQVQGLLDENEDFLAACIDYQNMGRVYEALQYQLKLHQNLLLLANFGDGCIIKHRVLGIKKSANNPITGLHKDPELYSFHPNDEYFEKETVENHDQADMPSLDHNRRDTIMLDSLNSQENSDSLDDSDYVDDFSDNSSERDIQNELEVEELEKKRAFKFFVDRDEYRPTVGPKANFIDSLFEDNEPVTTSINIDVKFSDLDMPPLQKS